MASKEDSLVTLMENEIPIHVQEVDTGFGVVLVHIQGESRALETKAVFLTVHDIGANHRSENRITEYSNNEIQFNARLRGQRLE